MEEAIAWEAIEGVVDVILDNCMYGGKRKKGTRIRTNVQELKQLEWICSGASDGLCDRTGALHEPWFSKAGSKIHTKDEAEYPWDLCTDIAVIWVLQGTFRR